MGDNDQNEILELRATLTAKEQEITELRDKLEALNKAVATVRHDANNPLA